MSDRMHELQQAAQELNPHWDVERAARLYAGTHQLRRRRAVRRVAVGSLLVLALTGGALLQLTSSEPEHAHASVQAAGAKAEAEAPAVKGNQHTLRLVDGSRAELAPGHTDLEVVENTVSRIDVRLSAGRAHFDVVHNPLRSFVVEAKPYRVEVIGTSFDVERSDGEVIVAVTRGKVRVYGPRGDEDLVAGQIKHFSTSIAPSAAPVVHEIEPLVEEEGDAPRAQPRKVKRNGGDSNWRSLSQSGQYDAAFESLRRGVVEDEPAALMDAADAARLSGHPQNAVQYLVRVVDDHRRSPVAPLAAFTLGRVYLDQLGQPEQAAEAFERARKLAPNGSLAQDALAREVEALSKGGNAQKAYQRAREYLSMYPNGRRVHAVQLYGGIN